MFHRILFLSTIVVALMVITIFTETADAQVVVGGRTYVQVPNSTYYYRTYRRPARGYYVGYPYSYPSYYYTPYVRQPYYPPYGSHYYPYPSYYYGPANVRYGNQWNYRRW